MKRDILDSLQQARSAKRPVALVTNLESGRQALLDDETVTGELTLGGPVLAQARQAILDNRSATLPGTDLFVQAFNPPLRMIVVGAVHIAQSLVPMAALAGYDVTVVDPRKAWATDARFPEVQMSSEWPDAAIATLAPDHRTAVIVLTHDPKLDDPALEPGDRRQEPVRDRDLDPRPDDPGAAWRPAAGQGPGYVMGTG